MGIIDRLHGDADVLAYYVIQRILTASYDGGKRAISRPVSLLLPDNLNFRR